MKATFQASLVGLLFLKIGTLFCQNSLQSQSNTKLFQTQSAVQIYHDITAEGMKTHWLICRNANEEGHDIVWKKDGRSLYLNRSKLSKPVPWKFFPIFCVKKTDAGIYTCHNTSKSETEQLLAEIMVNVTGTEHTCGKPVSDLEEIDLMCQTSTSIDFPCCMNFPGEPKNVEALNTLNSSYNFCKLYDQSLKEENEIQPWSIKVNWKLSRYDEYRTWGWQVQVVGLGGDTNFQYCVQINNKNKVHWTIPGLIFGATYLITVQPLPGGYGDDLKVVTKKLSIPSWQDMCEKGGRECKWEICWKVRNVTVIMEDKITPVLSWLPSQYHKSGSVYEVFYWSENNLDKGERHVKNKTRLILNNLKQNNCTEYLVKVRAIFVNGKKGMYSDEVKFDVSSTPGPAGIHTDIPNITRKIIIVCSSVPTALLILVLIVVIRKYFGNKNPPEPSPTPPNEEVNEVLIVHYGHCNLCDDVTHSLANVLNETGRIKSTVDMFCRNEIADCGVSWYEKKLTSCSKVLVICTKEGKKIYDEGEKHDINDSSSKVYLFCLKMMLGGKFHKNKVKVIPVYYDHSSADDIMYFMSDRPFYSLPTEIDKLLLSLSDINKRPLEAFKENDIDHTRKLEQKITELKNAIEIVEKDHNGNGKATLVKFFRRPLSCSSTGEPSSV